MTVLFWSVVLIAIIWILVQFGGQVGAAAAVRPRWIVIVAALLLVVLFVWRPGCRKENDPGPKNVRVGAAKKRNDKVAPKKPSQSPADKEKASGTIIGGPNDVVTDVKPEAVEDWMIQNMAKNPQGWELLQLVCEGIATRSGIIPLPISPVCFPEGKIECFVEGSEFGYGSCGSANLMRQDGKRLLHFSTHTQTVSISSLAALFVEVVGDVGSTAGDELYEGFKYLVELTPGPNVGLWIGSQKRLVDYPSFASPGLVPLKFLGRNKKIEDINWAMHLTMLPYEQLVPGEDLVRETISPPGFYRLYGYQVWLVPVDATIIDESKPYEEQLAVVKSTAVFTKVLRPSTAEREGLTRDHFMVTSEEVRDAWRKYAVAEPTAVRVYLEVRTPTLVRWELTFPLQ